VDNTIAGLIYITHGHFD